MLIPSKLYDVLPVAREYLNSERLLDALRKEGGVGYYDSFATRGSILQNMEESEGEGKFENLPRDVKKAFHDMRERIKGESLGNWTLENQFKKITLPVDVVDYLVYSGDALVREIPVEVFWQTNTLTDNAMEYGALVAAYALSMKNSVFGLFKHQAYEVSLEDGRTYMGAVSGRNHGDLTIYRKETTPYAVTSPLGGASLFYPRVKEDHWEIAGFHSAEPVLLSIVLAYAKQIGNKEVFEQSFIEKNIQQLQQAEFYSTTGSLGFQTYSSSPLPYISAQGKISKQTPHRLMRENNESGYNFFIGDDDMLIVTSFPKGGEVATQQEIFTTFHSLELVPLIKSLIYHVAFGYCRIRAHEFEQDMRRMYEVLG